MEKKEFNKYLEEELKKIDISINDIKKEKLYCYMKELLEWNEKINLTAIKDEKDFVVKHFVDSLSIVNYINYDKDSSINIIDVGTGGGFPGIPLRIYYDNAKITLLDSVNKKLKVIQSITEKYKINNVEFVHGRAEEIGKDLKHRENYNLVVSRAVANLTTLVEYLIPLCSLNDVIVCMKGPDAEEELKNAKNAIKLLGGKVETINQFKIGGEERNLIIIRKVFKTPKNYPRDNGIPLKKPIK